MSFRCSLQNVFVRDFCEISFFVYFRFTHFCAIFEAFDLTFDSKIFVFCVIRLGGKKVGFLRLSLSESPIPVHCCWPFFSVVFLCRWQGLPISFCCSSRGSVDAVQGFWAWFVHALLFLMLINVCFTVCKVVGIMEIL